MSDENFKYNSRVLWIPFFAVFSIWLVYFIEIKFGYNFNSYGIFPRTFKGLRGVIFSPFIHSGAKHLFSNSIPLAVMLSCLYYFYYKIAHKVLFFGVILTGLLTWVIARDSYHIGASGVIYFLTSFVFFSGVFRKYYRLVAVSLIVVFLYGGTIWYILPVENGISWEGHLAGFSTGLIFSILFRKNGPQAEKFQFSENKEFESYFDEDGNFNPPIEDTEKTE